MDVADWRQSACSTRLWMRLPLTGFIIWLERLSLMWASVIHTKHDLSSNLCSSKKLHCRIFSYNSDIIMLYDLDFINLVLCQNTCTFRVVFELSFLFFVSAFSLLCSGSGRGAFKNGPRVSKVEGKFYVSILRISFEWGWWGGCRDSGALALQGRGIKIESQRLL